MGAPAAYHPVAMSTTVKAGGEQLVELCGIASATVISFGGTEVVYGSGSAMGVTIDSGGTLIAAFGAELARVTNRGGRIISDVSSDVSNTGAIEALGPNALVLVSGATVSNSGAAAVIEASGSGAQIVLDGARSSGASSRRVARTRRL
jgi:autotransporter passenger strand-loop-strand repeat protein